MNMLETLRLRRAQADEYVRIRGGDMWGVRVAWFVISEGPAVARSMCSRYNKRSPAWKAYTNLVKSGIAVEGPEGGIRYIPCPEWEDDLGPFDWLDALSIVAAGGKKHPLL